MINFSNIYSLSENLLLTLYKVSEFMLTVRTLTVPVPSADYSSYTFSTITIAPVALLLGGGLTTLIIVRVLKFFID